MPAARANWKGFLRLSLVSCPVALFPATSDEKEISLNRINKATGNRLRQQNIDEVTKEVIAGDDIGKAYQVDKERRIAIEDEELEAIELESKRSIHIEQFVPAKQIDQRYIVRPYYIVPDGEAGEEAYAVIRDSMKEENVVGVGKVMLSSREHMIAIQPLGNGIMGNLLRYPSEVRKGKDYFGEIPQVEIPEDMLDMAKTLIQKYEGKFDPSLFKDRYGRCLARADRAQADGRRHKHPRCRCPFWRRHERRQPYGHAESIGRKRRGSETSPARCSATGRSINERPAPAKRSSVRGRKAG